MFLAMSKKHTKISNVFCVDHCLILLKRWLPRPIHHKFFRYVLQCLHLVFIVLLRVGAVSEFESESIHTTESLPYLQRHDRVNTKLIHTEINDSKPLKTY